MIPPGTVLALRALCRRSASCYVLLYGGSYFTFSHRPQAIRHLFDKEEETTKAGGKSTAAATATAAAEDVKVDIPQDQIP